MCMPMQILTSNYEPPTQPLQSSHSAICMHAADPDLQVSGYQMVDSVLCMQHQQMVRIVYS